MGNKIRDDQVLFFSLLKAQTLIWPASPGFDSSGAEECKRNNIVIGLSPVQAYSLVSLSCNCSIKYCLTNSNDRLLRNLLTSAIQIIYDNSHSTGIFK